MWVLFVVGLKVNDMCCVGKLFSGVLFLLMKELIILKLCGLLMERNFYELEECLFCGLFIVYMVLLLMVWF